MKVQCFIISDKQVLIFFHSVLEYVVDILSIAYSLFATRNNYGVL